MSRAGDKLNDISRNVLRVGGGRVSIGPAPKFYDKMGIVGKILNPIHIHIEPTKIWIDLNWFKVGFKLWGK